MPVIRCSLKPTLGHGDAQGERLGCSEPCDGRAAAAKAARVSNTLLKQRLIRSSASIVAVAVNEMGLADALTCEYETVQ